MRNESSERRKNWGSRLDATCLWFAASVPIAICIGVVVFEFFVAGVGLLWISKQIIAPDKGFQTLRKHPLSIPCGLFFCAIFLSALANGTTIHGYLHDLAMLRYMVFVWALLELSSRKPVVRYLLIGIAIGIGWGALNTVAAHWFGFDFVGKPLARYTGKLKEASRISGMAAFAAPFFLAWGGLDHQLGVKIRSLLISVGLIALALVLNFHIRTAILACLAAVFFLLGWMAFKRIHFTFRVGLLLIIAAILVFFLTNRKFYNLASIYDRIYYWKVAWGLWLKNPILGVGLSNFKEAYREMATSGKISAFAAPNGVVYHLENVYHAHNLFLMILSCLGIVGLVAFGWLFIKVVVLNLRNVTEWRIGLFTWPVVLIVNGLTGFNIFDAWYTTLFAFFTVMTGCFDQTSLILKPSKPSVGDSVQPQ